MLVDGSQIRNLYERMEYFVVKVSLYWIFRENCVRRSFIRVDDIILEKL